jgi:hypothetical protein
VNVPVKKALKKIKKDKVEEGEVLKRTPKKKEVEYVQVVSTQAGVRNGMGVAGFVLALLGLFFGWIPVLGTVIFILGLIFSVIGITREPKGLAIAGLAISAISILLSILLSILFWGMILSVVGSLESLGSPSGLGSSGSLRSF